MDYNLQHINNLEKLFWDGKTSPEQESELKSLSSNSKRFKIDFPELALYFSSQDDYKNIDVPRKLEQNILQQTISKKNTAKPILWFTGIAASLAMLIWIAPAQPSQEYSEQEVQQAYDETKKALFLLSHKIDNGNNYAMKLGEFERNQRKLKQSKTLNK